MDILTDYPKCLGDDVAAEIVQWNIEYNTRDTSSSENAEYELTVYLKNGYRLQEYSEIRDTEDAGEILHGLWERVEKQIRAIIGYRDYRGGALGKKGRADTSYVSLFSRGFDGIICGSVRLDKFSGKDEPSLPKGYFGLVETAEGRIGVCDGCSNVYFISVGGWAAISPKPNDAKPYLSSLTLKGCSIGQMKRGFIYMTRNSSNKKVTYIQPDGHGGGIVCECGHSIIVSDLALYMCSKEWLDIFCIAAQ